MMLVLVSPWFVFGCWAALLAAVLEGAVVEETRDAA